MFSGVSEGSGFSLFSTLAPAGDGACSLTLGKKSKRRRYIYPRDAKPTSQCTRYKKTYQRFAVCCLCGIVSLFVVGGAGSFAMFEITAALILIFWLFGSALISGGLSIIQPKVRLVWNIGYSLPVALWGASSLLMTPREIWVQVWFFSSLLPLLFGIIGDRIGRRLMQSRLSNDRPATTPVDY